MRIVSDKEDLSFVENVHCPEEHILCLCGQIVFNSADNESHDIRINFNSFHKPAFPAIGFYGASERWVKY